jgi:phosphoribosyl-dephospho-CoA transferase
MPPCHAGAEDHRMRDPRTHDILGVFELDRYLPTEVPRWAKTTLHGSSWVVVRSPATLSRGHLVGVRGSDPSQRCVVIAPHQCIVDVVVPEDIAGVRSWPTRNLPALQSLREVRARLNQLGLPWGPVGSVGFELATGQAATTSDSDLELIIRVPDLDPATIEPLVSLQDNHFRNLAARVDCEVVTPVESIRLAELVSGAEALT